MIDTAAVRNLRVAMTLPILVAAACNGAVRGPVGTSPVPATPVPVFLTGAAKARADSVNRPYTAADIHFMSGMIAHHAQAIVMAGWAPSHGAGGSVRILCERIINAQTDEIALMQQWLRDRSQPVPEPRATGMRMTMNGAEHDMLMPGMLSEDQMRQLDQARGAEFDRLFLTFMIQHHRGAVTMVKELFDSYGAGEDETVFKFASDVNVDQSTEIARMERMLVDITLSSP
jgi:uncharacterized protein (DUF305 family)